MKEKIVCLAQKEVAGSLRFPSENFMADENKREQESLHCPWTWCMEISPLGLFRHTGRFFTKIDRSLNFSGL